MLFHTITGSHPRRQLLCIENGILSSQKNICCFPDRTKSARMPSTGNPTRYNNPSLCELKKPPPDLPCAQGEVEMIASILNTSP